MTQLQLFTAKALRRLGMGRRPRTVIFRCPRCPYVQKDRVRKERRNYHLGTRALEVIDRRIVQACPSCAAAMQGDVVATSNLARHRCHPRCRFARRPLCECECNGRYHQAGLAA